MNSDRSYPVPAALQAAAGTAAMRLPEIESVVALGHFDQLREWALRVVENEYRQVDRTLVACAADPALEHYGILDPDHDEPLVIAVVALAPSGEMRRWNGSGWDTVPDELEPVGYQYIHLADESLLADALRSPGGLLLRPTRPKASCGGHVVASVAGAKHFAIVDEFDTTAVLDLIEVRPGPVVLRREGGEWVRDNSVLARLRSVDPPTVVVIADDEIDSVTAQVDDFDRSADKGVVAALWDESKYKRDKGGKFAPKDGGGANGRPSMTAAQLREYVATGKLPADVRLRTGIQKREAEAAKKASKGRGGGGGGGGSAKKGAAKKSGSGGGRGSGGSGSRGGGSGGSSGAAKKAAAAKKTAATAAKKAASDRTRALKDAKAAEKRKMREAWAAEDSADRARDAAYDIQQQKDDLAEQQARDEFDAKVRQEWKDLLANAGPDADPDEVRNRQNELVTRAQAEIERRAQYEKAASTKAKAERIRRMENRERKRASRYIQQSRFDATWEQRLPTTVVAAPAERSMMPRKLKTYWTRGKGAAKIRWDIGGDFNRCRRALAKYLRPDQVAGACANLHKAATGVWPGKNRGH